MVNSGYSFCTTKVQIINIVRRSLGYIDRRLIEHGERVAYIAHMIAQADPGLAVDRENLFTLCLLHDIGAYKTEEIDSMVDFETKSAVNHAAYGYVFLRNATSLGDRAEPILYHHTDYSALERIDTPAKLTAELIFLADRIDILLESRGREGLPELRKLEGTMFSPELTELFFLSERENHISEHIFDLSYKDFADSMICGMDLSTSEVMSYLRMLVLSIDFRSPFTVTHTANTTEISRALAELFQLDGGLRASVMTGAFLHDVGKIAIPYSILESPGRLSPEEMEIMKTHVDYSEDILRGVVPDEVCEIAVRHHEKLNGCGYSHGLTAEELTLPQRIVAVADVMSALTSRRSYKEPFPKEKALSIIKSMRDLGELDSEVCDMVESNFDYIISATAQADDPVVELYEKIKAQYAQCNATLLELNGR